MMYKHTNFISLSFTTCMKKWVSIIGFCFLLFSIAQAQDASANTSANTSVELEQQVFEIARKVRCPVCRAESAADSNATTSIEFRNIIQEKLEQGQSEAEIIAFFQASYGDWILLDPPKRGLHLIVWIAPVVAAILALGIFLVLLRRWTRKANSEPMVLSAKEIAIVQKALRSSSYHPDNDPAMNKGASQNTSKTISGDQS